MSQNINTPTFQSLEDQIKADEASRFSPDEPFVSPTDERLEARAAEKVRMANASLIAAAENQDDPDENPTEEGQAAEPESDVESKVELKAETETEFEKRIAEAHYEKRQFEKQARALQLELSRLRGEAPPAPIDEQVSKLAEQRAKEMAFQQAHYDRGERIRQDGLKQFPDFSKQVDVLFKMEFFQPDVVLGLSETGVGPQLVQYLGKNPDIAEKIQRMTPIQAGAYMGKLATKFQKIDPPQVSAAPPPIKSVGGKANVSRSEENMPMDEWIKLDAQRTADRRKNRYQ